MAASKDQKFNMVMTGEDKSMLVALSNADDLSEAHIVRSLIRRAYAERFGDKKPKVKR